MPERTVTVASSSGLHARPAALFVKAAAAQPVPVKLRVGDGPTADARSILAVLALRVGHGATVTLIAPDEGTDGSGAEAEQALDTLADLLSRDLDAEPVNAASANTSSGNTSSGNTSSANPASGNSAPAHAAPANAEPVDG